MIWSIKGICKANGSFRSICPFSLFTCCSSCSRKLPGVSTQRIVQRPGSQRLKKFISCQMYFVPEPLPVGRLQCVILTRQRSHVATDNVSSSSVQSTVATYKHTVTFYLARLIIALSASKVPVAFITHVRANHTRDIETSQ